MATREQRQALEAAQVEQKGLNDVLAATPEVIEGLAASKQLEDLRHEVVRLERDVERLRDEHARAEREGERRDLELLGPKHFKERTELNGTTRTVEARAESVVAGLASGLIFSLYVLGGSDLSWSRAFIALLPCLLAAYSLTRRQP